MSCPGSVWIKLTGNKNVVKSPRQRMPTIIYNTMQVVFIKKKKKKYLNQIFFLLNNAPSIHCVSECLYYLIQEEEEEKHCPFKIVFDRRKRRREIHTLPTKWLPSQTLIWLCRAGGAVQPQSAVWKPSSLCEWQISLTLLHIDRRK